MGKPVIQGCYFMCCRKDCPNAAELLKSVAERGAVSLVLQDAYDAV